VLAGALEAAPEVRVALGPTAPGIEGFRRSHLDALATQRLMHRGAAGLRLAHYEDVQVVALATADEERADEFVARTLGAFASAPAELRETARVYLRERSNATRTARLLFTHRNTIISRLARMEELLPAPLDGRALSVALALEILHWRGANG
jgi:DNA-binding PucR family transcriptional regulator